MTLVSLFLVFVCRTVAVGSQYLPFRRHFKLDYDSCFFCTRAYVYDTTLVVYLFVRRNRSWKREKIDDTFAYVVTRSSLFSFSTTKHVAREFKLVFLVCAINQHEYFNKSLYYVDALSACRIRFKIHIKLCSVYTVVGALSCCTIRFGTEMLNGKFSSSLSTPLDTLQRTLLHAPKSVPKNL